MKKVFGASTHNKAFLFIFYALFVAFANSAHARGHKDSVINNPVLPGVADAGVIKYNGEYYIGGVFTNGGFYRSKDLVKWEGPFHVFSMNNSWTDGPSAGDNQIHASDISYINGIFHKYWSVNYWGRDKNVVHIGHAVSPNILGPYKEPVKDTWLDNRIDPKLFIDDDGKLYMYMVKFTDGNTIWVRPMKDPANFSGDPVYLFSSLPNTWETMDNRVEEGPWVMKYRNRYYLMYNSNHTSTEWGNYALGVAEADSPMGFNHGTKYTYPVVKSNQWDLEDTYADLLKYSPEDRGAFLYTFEDPHNEKWAEIKYNDQNWLRGKAGFGSSVVKGSTTRDVKTEWKSGSIWLRKSFIINKRDAGNLTLRVHHDGDTKIFLNGRSIYEGQGRNYKPVNLDKKLTAALIKDGENILAVESNSSSRSNFLDVSLFDMKDQKADDILYSPGQPNILRGPNGFEWWLIYMANKNSERRGQYINRVHFFNKTLFVDGITGANTAGSHPEPARPAFSDLFDQGDLKRNWDLTGGNWNTKESELVQNSDELSRAVVKSFPATHYLFEANLKMDDQGTGGAGIVAFWQDENNWLRIGFDKKDKKWLYMLQEAGKPVSMSFPLPVDFNYNVYHSLTIYKNAADFDIRIDGLPAPANPVIKTNFKGKGLPGLYSQSAAAAFDGVIYTPGWDEFDSTIRGWYATSGQEAKEGAWIVSNKGISCKNESGEHSVFKGDMTGSYEFAVQVATERGKGSAGIYPIYVDEKNYIKAVIDYEKQELYISGLKNGKAIKVHRLALQQRSSQYADMRYTDFFEKHYTLASPAYINAMEFNKQPYKGPDTLLTDIDKKMDIFYRQADKWFPLNDYQNTLSQHPGFSRISFKPVWAEGLKFSNKQGGDMNMYIYKIWLNELIKRSYNLRVIRREANLSFFLDGKEVLTLNSSFPASKVGLVTRDTKSSFNGITFFHLPANTEQ